MSPLSGRPCAAWRLGVEYTALNSGSGPSSRAYFEYCAASFSLETPTGPVFVHVDASPIARFFPDDAGSRWLIPPGADADSITVRIENGQAILPRTRGLRSRASVRQKPGLWPSSKRLTCRPRRTRPEAIVDLDREWICEGPVHVEGSRTTIVSSPYELPVKLAPADSYKRVLWTVLGPVVGIFLVLEIMLLVVQISMLTSS